MIHIIMITRASNKTWPQLLDNWRNASSSSSGSSSRSSSSNILLTYIYKGWGKSQHIITNTNIVHLTGYLKHVMDDAMAYQVYIYIQTKVGGDDTVNNQFERISPSGDCQGSGSSTDSYGIDHHLIVAATAPSSQSRIKVKNIKFHTTILRWRWGVSVITHVYHVGVHDNNSLRPCHLLENLRIQSGIQFTVYHHRLGWWPGIEPAARHYLSQSWHRMATHTAAQRNFVGDTIVH